MIPLEHESKGGPSGPSAVAIYTAILVPFLDSQFDPARRGSNVCIDIMVGDSG